VKKGDFFWGLGILAFAAFIAFPQTQAIFNAATAAHPYLMGFGKFAILATMGELLARRIIVGKWEKPSGLVWRAVIWGFLGMAIVAIFTIFSTGVGTLVEKGVLPGKGSVLLTAFWISAIMNTTFAPTMMGLHRFTDTFIDLKYSRGGKITTKQVVDAIDWNGYVSFVLCKTIPIFWIPAHTITFMLPAEYRVLMAAFLSMALGAILAFAKKKK
jgi:hypothetical protein